MLKSADEDVYEDSGSPYSRSDETVTPNQTAAMDSICYTCSHDECEAEDVPTCSGYACFSTHVTEGTASNGRQYFKKGCTDTHSYGFHCRSNFFRGKNPNAGKYFTECCRTNFCNSESSDVFFDRVSAPAVPAAGSPPSGSAASVFLIIVPSICFIIAAIGLIYWLTCGRKRHEKNNHNPHFTTYTATSIPINNNRRDPESPMHGDEMVHFMESSSYEGESGLKAVPVGNSTLSTLISDNGLSSGSGSGMPQLCRLTFAREIVKGIEIGRGCYGSVYKGSYRGDTVAIKVFPTHEEASFNRECDLYAMQMFRHPNILGFIGSDIKSVQGEIEFWLVTEYHEHRSLFEFLKHHSLTLRDAHSVLRSASAGLMHLHLPLHTGTTSKPGIAHRDLKPKNLLMKACRDRTGADVWEVVIADFGLAVRQTDVSQPFVSATTCSRPSEGKEEVLRVGTKRYMSPEVLDDSIRTHADLFSVMTKSDIYSFALVMWETLRRVEMTSESGGKLALDYMLAYEDIVPSDPSYERMRKVVVTDGHRPEFPAEWSSSRPLSRMREIICECWLKKPEARLTIKKIHNKLLTVMQESD